MTIRNTPVQTEDVAREELAKTWHRCGKLGLTNTTFNYISFSLSVPRLRFLMNRYGQLAVDALAMGQEHVVLSDAERRIAGEQLRCQRPVFALLMWAALCGS